MTHGFGDSLYRFEDVRAGWWACARASNRDIEGTEPTRIERGQTVPERGVKVPNEGCAQRDVVPHYFVQPKHGATEILDFRPILAAAGLDDSRRKQDDRFPPR